MEALAPERLARVAAAVLGPDAPLSRWHAREVPYESGSPATAALRRVAGETASGQQWSAFLKVLQHVRHWPRLHLLPPEFRQQFVDSIPWRDELAAWQPGFADRLPAGIRLPVLYLVDDLGDDRLALWMEDIQDTGGWDLDRFARAAAALGWLAARRSDAELLAANQGKAGLRWYEAMRVRGWALSMLQDDQVWQHPLLATADLRELRAEVQRFAERTAVVLAELDRLPQALPHGDASPQNLLVPRGEPETFVMIDISFQAPHAVGFDLGQLLVGLVHAGVLPADSLLGVHETILPSFVDGYVAGGGAAGADEIAYGYVGSLLVRSGLSSLPFELLGNEPTPEVAATFRERAALTRFILDLAAKHL